MKSAIFFTWFFTIVFFSHGLNTQHAGASPAIKQIAQQAAAPAPEAFNRLTPLDLPPETAQPAEVVQAAYVPAEVEPGAGEAPRFNPLARNAQRYGTDAESYLQNKQDLLMQALMK